MKNFQEFPWNFTFPMWLRYFLNFSTGCLLKKWLVRNAMFKETAAGSGLAQRNLEKEAQTQSNEDHHPWLLRWCFFSRVQTMGVGCWVAEFSNVNFRCLMSNCFFEKAQVCIQRSKKKKMDCGTSGGGGIWKIFITDSGWNGIICPSMLKGICQKVRESLETKCLLPDLPWWSSIRTDSCPRKRHPSSEMNSFSWT